MAVPRRQRSHRDTPHLGRYGCVLFVLMLSSMACSHARDIVFQTHAAEEANQDSPVRIELLWVYDEELVGILSQMTAQEWFDQRTQLERLYGSAAFRSHYWERVPETNTIEQLYYDGDAETGFVFAGYRSPGDHRAEITPSCSLKLQLERDKFAVLYLEPLEECE